MCKKLQIEEWILYLVCENWKFGIVVDKWKLGQTSLRQLPIQILNLNCQLIIWSIVRLKFQIFVKNNLYVNPGQGEKSRIGFDEIERKVGIQTDENYLNGSKFFIFCYDLNFRWHLTSLVWQIQSAVVCFLKLICYECGRNRDDNN